MSIAQQVIGNLGVMEKEAQKALARMRTAAVLKESGDEHAAGITHRAAIEAVENIESMAAIMLEDLT